MSLSNYRPVILAIGGHDPTGGAGIQADIEAISANGGRAVTLVTALTVQNSARFQRCIPVATDTIMEAAQALTEDIDIQAIKIGLVPNAAIAETIAALLDRFSKLPVVLDPVLASGTGSEVADAQTAAALVALLRRVTVVTPNTDEARRLTSTRPLGEAAATLLEAGAANVLVTGTHAQTPEVINTLYQRTHSMHWSWPRLPHVYHGSGCTLASALATWLASGVEVTAACSLAQAFAWQSLAQAVRLGKAQYHPQRLAGSED
ncbi:MAG: hydroxymethylpyrimidine/phosphomethylpyrimidine kinase [Gammaproteobacteria bacterium]